VLAWVLVAVVALLAVTVALVPRVMNKAPDASTGPRLSSRDRWRIVGGLLGLIGSGIGFVGTWGFGLAYYFFDSKRWLPWFLALAVLSVFVLALRSRWPVVVGAAGLLVGGACCMVRAVLLLANLRSSGFGGQDLAVVALVASIFAVLGGLLVLVGQERERGRPQT